MATKVYRDFGALNGMSAPNNEFDVKRYTQVYQATHEGEKRLPFMNRSFISFSYGEKPDVNGQMRPVYIEDFSLIATISGDRWQREAYASFDDLTSTYDTIPGQFYWGTYFHSYTLNFTLSTDAMTQRELDDFKLWFRAGQIKELILAEHPNRAALARVSAQPRLNLLPFEEKITIPISSGDANINEQVIVRNYTTSTTLYKGDIELELTLDEPFWYAKQNILGSQNTLEGFYDESWIDANGNFVPVKDTPDALKIIYEDRIPLGSTTRISVFLGGDTYASVLYETYSLIAQEIDEGTYNATQTDENLTDATKSNYFNNGDTQIDGIYYFPTITEPYYTKYYRGAVIATMENNQYVTGGKVGGADFNEISDQTHEVALPVNESANLYYAGTAPSPVTLKFTLIPQFESSSYMINSPRNKYTTDEKPYNTITLTAVNEHNFDFTIPTLYASYNQVMKILSDENIVTQGNAWLMLRETIRDTIRHPIVRAWANKMIDKYDNEYGSGIMADLRMENTDSNEGVSFDSILGDIKEGMSCLFKQINTLQNTYIPTTVDEETGETIEGEPVVTETKTFSNEAFPATFVFNGKTGEAVGHFTTWDPSTLKITPITHNESTYIQTSLREQILNNESLATKNFVENVGDMVKSSYLVLDERNVLDDNFQVQAWEKLHPDYAYLIEHDVQDRLMDLHFEFKNMYL